MDEGFDPAKFIKDIDGKVVKNFTLEIFGICEKCKH
jgi:Fe2+ or Zn2+ uptake regulation protein